MCARLYPAGLNIDYYPTNFVPCGGALYYIDYECNVSHGGVGFLNIGGFSDGRCRVKAQMKSQLGIVKAC